MSCDTIITDTIKKMYGIHCENCLYYEMELSRCDNTFMCSECYATKNIYEIGELQYYFKYNKLIKFIISNPQIAKKIIVKYLILIGYLDEFVYNKNIINEYCKDIFDNVNKISYEYKLCNVKQLKKIMYV